MGDCQSSRENKGADVALVEGSTAETDTGDSGATTAFTITTNHQQASSTPCNLSPDKSSEVTHTGGNNGTTKPFKPKRDTKKESLEAKRERKAAKTLAIITGAFVMCWLPFFIMALLMPLCESCYINDNLASFFLWLGYFNSTLNPVIYTIFSPEFRQAFKRILCGVSHSRSRQLR